MHGWMDGWMNEWNNEWNMNECKKKGWNSPMEDKIPDWKI